MVTKSTVSTSQKVRDHCHSIDTRFFVYIGRDVLFRDMGFEGGDKTDRFLIAARRRAQAAMHETSPKLTALEKAMWLNLKRGERPCNNNKAQ